MGQVGDWPIPAGSHGDVCSKYPALLVKKPSAWFVPPAPAQSPISALPTAHRGAGGVGRGAGFGENCGNIGLQGVESHVEGKSAGEA